MTELQQFEIAVVGTEEQVELMRLGGATRSTVVDIDDPEAVTAAAAEFASDPSVGIVLIPDMRSDCAAALRKKLAERRATTPVILEFPSRHREAAQGTAKEHYEGLTKHLIGLTIKL